MAIIVKTITNFPLNGSNREFDITFDYLARRFVKVAIIGGETRQELTLGVDYRFVTKTRIRTTVALGATWERIEIRRETSATDRVVNFSDGSVLRAKDLNTSQIQAIHVAEEARDGTALGISQNDLGNLDAKGRRITNLGEPLQNSDATSKGYVDGLNATSIRLPYDVPAITGDARGKVISIDDNGNPVAVIPSASSELALAALLRSTSGSGQIGFITGSTVEDELRDSIKGYFFSVGGLLHSVNDHVYDVATKAWYFWDEAYPKEVKAGDSPESGWIPVAGQSTPQTLDTLSILKSHGVINGSIYETKGYWSVGDGGGATYYAKADGSDVNGYSDHAASNGVRLYLISEPTDLNHGVKVSPFYVPHDARWNRNALQCMIRDVRWSNTECIAKGTVYHLGSTNIGRDNINFKINKGCFLRGRYSDPSIPTPDQAGGMINFVKYLNPDIGDFSPWRDGDMRVVEYITNVHVTLDGDVSTEYNDIHDHKTNNNCISMAKSINCSIKGVGGVSESDHRGLNFDAFDTNAPNGSENRGGAINCHIDVAYINGCIDNPAMMAGDRFSRSLCTVKIGSVGPMRPGGYDNPIVVNVSGALTSHKVEIGSFDYTGGVKPDLIVARDCISVEARLGVVNGAKTLIYTNGCLDNDLEVAQVYNTPVGVYLGGTTGIRTVRIANIKQTDSNLKTLYVDGANLNGLLRLEIRNNNLSSIGAGFNYYTGITPLNVPRIELISDNTSPLAGDGGKVLNRLPGNRVITNGVDGLTTVAIDFKDSNWNFSKITVVCKDGAARGSVEIDLISRSVTSEDVTVMCGRWALLTSMISGGGIITLTPPSPVLLNYVVLHN